MSRRTNTKTVSSREVTNCPPLSSFVFRPVDAPATAGDILSWGHNIIGNGKEQRDLLHSLVHKFREAHAWVKDHSKREGYDKVVDRMQRVPSSLPDREDILLLSKPDSYLRIRQAGRCRSYQDKLTTQEIRSLCREIRAALVWSSKKRFNN